MRPSQSIRFLAGAFVVFAAATIAAPAAFACGPHENGEGHQRHHHHDGEDNNGSENDGPRHGHHGHHGRHGDVDVGVGVYDPPGYGHGRIGPPTGACAELRRMRGDLARLFNLRTQVNSGKRMIVTRNGQQRVVSTRGWRNGVSSALEGGGGSVNDNVAGLNYGTGLMDEARDTSMAIVDGRIEATQARIHELEYQCQE